MVANHSTLPVGSYNRQALTAWVKMRCKKLILFIKQKLLWTHGENEVILLKYGGSNHSQGERKKLKE